MNKLHMKNILDIFRDKERKGMSTGPGIRVLLVNCSDSEMQSIRYEIEKGKGFKVVGMARDDHQARQMVKSLKPDLLIMDILDPRSGGIGFLKRLQHFHPIPVILISPVSKMTFRMAVSAFELGNIRIIDKDSLDIFRKNGKTSQGLQFFRTD
ncbi:MAG: response regulator [bacterium]